METAIDAERAFAKMAREKGQWTAFRYFAASEAMMFVPEPVNAQDWLRDRVNPSKSVEWSPKASYVSCDGGTSINTGEWRRPDGSTGYFTTVWVKQIDGHWRWILDHGDTLTSPLAPVASAIQHRASCSKPIGRPLPRVMWRWSGLQRSGESADGSLRWFWRINTVQLPLPRYFEANLWTGKHWTLIAVDDVPSRRP